MKELLVKHGYVFESETDTEVMAKMIEHLHEKNPHAPFRDHIFIEIFMTELLYYPSNGLRKVPFPGIFYSAYSNTRWSNTVEHISLYKLSRL